MNFLVLLVICFLTVIQSSQAGVSDAQRRIIDNQLFLLKEGMLTEKEVFKTYSVIDQMYIIYQAANRQNFIDEGQSVNIMIHPDMSVKEINNIYISAWKLGLKSLYYQHSMNAAQKFNQKKDCASCEA